MQQQRTNDDPIAITPYEAECIQCICVIQAAGA